MLKSAMKEVFSVLSIMQEAIKDFERNASDLVSSFTETIQALVAQLRDLENQHHERLLELAVITLEKVIKNELDDEISDDLREASQQNDSIA